MFDVKIQTDVVSELITLSEVKSQLYITHSDDDTKLTALITDVRKEVENWLSISIGSQTRIWTVDLPGHEETVLPFGPVTSITTVEYKEDYNDYSTMTVYVDYDTDGQFNKTLTPFIDGRYKITYVTGFTSLPGDLKLGMLNEIVNRYENRGDKNGTPFSDSAWELIKKYKDYSWW